MGDMSFTLVLLVCCGAIIKAQTNPPQNAPGVVASSQTQDDISSPTPTVDTTTSSASVTTQTTKTPESSTTKSTPAPTTELTTSTSTNSSTIVTTEHPTVAPTVVPTPNPVPKMGPAGSWNITNSTEAPYYVCFKMEMAAQIRFVEDNVLKGVNLPKNATIMNQGCSQDKLHQNQNFTLQWDTDEHRYVISFEFHYENTTDKDDPKSSVVLQNLTIQRGQHPKSYLSKEDKLLAAHSGKSYKCNHQQTINLSDNYTLIMENVQVEAFMTGQDFDGAEECSNDDTTSDIVPIAVGCALGGLVVIVLIAYVVGRRISRKKGYQSV